MPENHENEILNVTKKCTSCGQTKPLHEFYVCHSSPDGRGYQCAECLRSAQRRRNQQKRHKSVALRVSQFSEEFKRSQRGKLRNEMEHDFECAVIGCHRAATLHHLNYADFRAVVPLCKSHHAYLTGSWNLLRRVALELGIDADAILDEAFTKGFSPDAFEDPFAVAECKELRAASRWRRPPDEPEAPAQSEHVLAPQNDPQQPAPQNDPETPAPFHRQPTIYDNAVPPGRDDSYCGLSAVTG